MSSTEAPDFENLSIPLPKWYKKWLEYLYWYDRLQGLIIHAFFFGLLFTIFVVGITTIISSFRS